MELWVQYLFVVCIVIQTVAYIAEKITSIFQIRGTKPYANLSAVAAAAAATFMREFGKGKPDAHSAAGNDGAGKNK